MGGLAATLLAELALTVETVEVGHQERSVSGGGIRRTAVVRLRGDRHEGSGEEVTFQTADLLARNPERPWPFVGSLGEFWRRLDDTELFVRPPLHDVVRHYRRWAFGAAALDLALRQAEVSLADVLDRHVDPVRFVISPTGDQVHRFPCSRLKIDAVDLAAGLPVDVVDFKGQGDAALAEQALALYPEALQEDPPVVIDGARVSWDATILSADDVFGLATRPAAINVKPARLGGFEALLELYEACADRGIAVYGGGQHELGPGRTQIQLLAALFHPDAPNDVAPVAYNDAAPPPELPPSPLTVVSHVGFG